MIYIVLGNTNNIFERRKKMRIIVSGLDLLLKRDALNAGGELVWQDLENETCEIVFPENNTIFIDSRSNIVSIDNPKTKGGVCFNLANCEFVKIA